MLNILGNLLGTSVVVGIFTIVLLEIARFKNRKLNEDLDEVLKRLQININEMPNKETQELASKILKFAINNFICFKIIIYLCCLVPVLNLAFLYVVIKNYNKMD